MKKQTSHSHIIDLLMPVGLLMVFGVCAITVLLLATRIYKSTVDQSATNYTAQTSLAYVTEKLHAHDERGAVRIGNIDDVPSIIITETHNEQEYITYIYCYNGFLCELFARSDIELNPEAGDRLLEISDFNMEQNADILELSCTDNEGNEAHAFVTIRSY